MLLVPSPCPCPSRVAFVFWFCSCFQQNNSGTSMGCSALEGSWWDQSSENLTSSVASLPEGQRHGRCLDVGGGRTSAFVGPTRQQQWFPCPHQGRRHWHLTDSSQTFPPACTPSHLSSTCLDRFRLSLSFGAARAHAGDWFWQEAQPMHAVGPL